MAGDGYYPEYYLRKRKRDRAYSIATQVIGALVVFGGLGILTVFLLFQYVIIPRKTQAGVTSQMATDRQQLSTQEKLATAEQEHEPAPVPVEQKDVDLSQVTYADSMPGTAVAIQGLPTASAAEIEPAAESNPSGELEPTPDTSQPGVTPPADGQAATAPIEKPKMEAKPERKKEELKTEKKPEPKPAEKKKVEDKAIEKPEPAPARVETTVYRVYAGSAQDKAAADELKSRLSGMGYSGTIIKSGPEYLVLVDAMEDFDRAKDLSSDLQGKGFSSFTTRSKAKR